MTFDSIWDEEGNWLTKSSKGFRARSTGCSCCSSELTTEAEVKKEVIDTLTFILRGADYFKWDVQKLLREAKKSIEVFNAKDNKRDSS